MPRPVDTHSASKARLLDTAARLFATRGYASVRLRDIAQQAGLHHTSLYHYLPGGKEALYLTVMQQSFDRHRTGLEQAAQHAPPALRARLYALADWFISQPPIDTARMMQVDVLELSPDAALKLAEHAYSALREPIVAVLTESSEALAHLNFDQAAMALVSLVQSAHTIPAQYLHTPDSKVALAHSMVDMLLDGWLPRSSGEPS